ncbi:MAG TPA: hypothetical protein VHP37_22125 [Burkholderiales bacterium]|nr:hypothetical protein [Burkholderiales bacterium]
MKRYLLAFVLCLLAGVAQAKGVPFAVKSLSDAQTLARQSGGKHVLVFFTSEN